MLLCLWSLSKTFIELPSLSENLGAAKPLCFRVVDDCGRL